MHRTMWWFMGATVVLLGLILAQAPTQAAGPARPQAKARATIVIAEAQGMFMFSPARRVVAPGTTVTWKNTSGEKHDLTFTSGRVSHGDLDVGQSVSLVFTKPGTYRYLCDFHTGMSGVIIVTGAAAGAPGASAAHSVPPRSGGHDDHGHHAAHDDHGSSHGSAGGHDDHGQHGVGHA